MPLRKLRVVASALSCLVATSGLSGLVWAEDPAPGSPKAAAPAPPASAPSPAVQAGPSPGAPAAATPAGPSPEVMAEAKQRFDRGFELYEEGEYPLALIEFNRAYELVPNYRVLYNIGQVCIQLGQYANARRALQEYTQQGADTLTPDRRASVNKDLDMLARRTAFLTVNGNVEFSEVLVDDVLVGKTPLDAPLLVDAGVHRVTLRRSGYLPRTSNVTLAGGDEQTVNVTLEVQPDEKQTIVVREREIVESSAQTWIIAGWATTGALIAGAVVTGIMGANEADELEQLRGADFSTYENPSLADRITDTKNNAQTLLLASDIMSGAALIVGGLSLWITLDPPEPERAVVPEKPAPKPDGVQVGYSDGQVQLRGSF
jgi:hypothetical protein